MADSDVITVDEPQTGIVTAFAAYRLYMQLAQSGPTHNVSTYQGMAQYWLNEAKDRCLKYGMKQRPITRSF